MRYAGRTARGSALAARIDAVPIALALPRLLICSRPVPPQYKIDSPVADIQWVGSDKKVCAALARCAPCACTQVRLLMVRRSRLLQTIYVRSSKNFVYRSEDEGRSWERQNWKMEKTSDDEKSGILSFHVSPSDTNKVRRRGRCCAQRRNRRASPATYIGWLVACAALLPWRGQTALGHARPRRQVHSARASVHDQGGQDPRDGATAPCLACMCSPRRPPFPTGQDPPDGARVDDGVASDGGLQRRRAQGVQHGGLPHPGCAAAPHLHARRRCCSLGPSPLQPYSARHVAPASRGAPSTARHVAPALFGAPRGRARPRNRACPPGARHGARSPPWALPPRRRLAAGPAARHGALPDRRSPRRAPR